MDNDDAFLKIVGQRVRDLRKKRDLSQEQLGELAGFHFSYIGGLERGQKNVTLLNLNKIAQSLNVPFYELFAYNFAFNYGNGEKEQLLNELFPRLTTMKVSDLRKLQRLMDEIIN